MKKFLSIMLAVGFSATMFSQTLWSDNFESYNVGNLGTNGGWGRDGGAAAIAKVANITPAYGKSFQFASTLANNAAGAFIYHDTNWTARNPANGIFVAEFDVYTGSTFSEIQFYNVVGTEYYAIADLYMSPTNGVFLADQNDFDNEESGIELPLTVTANTWYKVKLTYDVMGTGDINVTIDGVTYGPYEKLSGYFPLEVDLVATGANTSGYDNLKMSAVETLLAVSDASAKSKVSVYPNPTSDIINIKSDKKIADVTLFDTTGKIAKKSNETTINVENLAKGTYIVSIKFADGSVESSKVIKN